METNIGYISYYQFNILIISGTVLGVSYDNQEKQIVLPLRIPTVSRMEGSNPSSLTDS